MSKIAFLGAGNMAAAIVDGLLRTGAASAQNLICLSASGHSAAQLAAHTGIHHAATPEELCQHGDVLVVAFKPKHLTPAATVYAPLSAGKLVISLLAGKTLAQLHAVFPQARNIVRTMPNTPARIGAGVTAWCSLQPLTTDDRAMVCSLLEALGTQLEVAETQMDAITAISGSGPGFFFEYAAAVREAAVTAGLSAEIAHTLTVQTLLGSARLLAQTGTDPETLRDQVTSPNGTTHAGLGVLARADFRALVRKTVLAARDRAGEISRES